MYAKHCSFNSLRQAIKRNIPFSIDVLINSRHAEAILRDNDVKCCQSFTLSIANVALSSRFSQLRGKSLLPEKNCEKKVREKYVTHKFVEKVSLSFFLRPIFSDHLASIG